MNLEGRVAIVTGGAAGIGLAIAKRYLTEGIKVVIADIDSDKGERAVEALKHTGVVKFIRSDVANEDDVRSLVSSSLAAFGHIDILVNNAAVIHASDFLDLAVEDFDRVLGVNLRGSFLVGQAVARHMVERVRAGGPAGTIINMSSVNAVFALASSVPYSISKGGISSLTKVMALALAEHGIRVNAIGPGSIQTDMLASLQSDPSATNRLLSRTPLGRIGEPSEIASVAAFLASADASYLTGQTIYCDGGRLPLNYTVPVK